MTLSNHSAPFVQHIQWKFLSNRAIKKYVLELKIRKACSVIKGFLELRSEEVGR